MIENTHKSSGWIRPGLIFTFCLFVVYLIYSVFSTKIGANKTSKLYALMLDRQRQHRVISGEL